MIKQLVSRIVLIFIALTLAGCFFSDTPILLPVDSDRLPGGDGKFQAIEENQEETVFIQVEKLDSVAHRYQMHHVDEDGKQQKIDMLFKKLGDDIYLVQMYASKKYAVFSAKIDENSLRFFEYDESTFEEQLKTAGFELLTYRILSNNSGAEKQARQLQQAGRSFAINRIGGYTLLVTGSNP